MFCDKCNDYYKPIFATKVTPLKDDGRTWEGDAIYQEFKCSCSDSEILWSQTCETSFFPQATIALLADKTAKRHFSQEYIDDWHRGKIKPKLRLINP